MRFLSSFGMLPGTWRNLALIVFSGIAEGFGLSLFIPLLHLMTGRKLAELPQPFPHIVTVCDAVGLAVTPLTLLAVIPMVILGSLALGYQQRKMLINAKQLYSRNLRNDFFEAFLRATWDYSSNRSHGEFINQLTVECNRSGNALGYELMAVAVAAQISLYMAFSTLISWQLMILAVAFGAIVYFAVRPLSRRAKVFGESNNQSNRDLGFFGIEYLRSLKLLKATATEDFALRTMAQKSDRHYRVLYDSELNTTRVYFIVQALPVILLTLIIGISYEIMATPVSLILVFLLFMARIAPRVAQFQQQLQGYSLTSPALRLIIDLVEESRARKEGLNPGGKVFERIRDAIAIEGVTFAFAGSDAPAIDNASLSIGRNRMIAIVGSSGAGKSTLVDVLIGLRRPDTGRITIDGTDLNDFDMVSWRRRIGIVPQDATVFNASIGDNLRFFSPDASDDDIAEALRLAHLDDVVAGLPDGFDTILGEGGVRLSGGQRQRVALARALVGRPELLLLDEATSALDNESERYVQDAISAIAHTMTIVVIAHRLSTVRRADAIYVMERGRIVETGTYDALLKRGGRFAELKGLELS